MADDRARATGLLIVSVAAIQAPPAFADAEVRFAHAVAGAERAELRVAGSTRALGRAAFAKFDGYRTLPAGRVRLRLVAAAGGRALATGSARLRDGRRYTVVALLEGQRVKLNVYPDGRAKRGVVRVRVIHGVPAFPNPDVAVDGKTVAPKLAYQAATPYLALEPGRHTFAAMSTPGGQELFAGKVDVDAAKAYTALIVGASGERPMAAVAVDDTARRRRRRDSTARGSATYVVRRGDSLWTIAARQLGSASGAASVASRLVEIWNANEERIGTGDPNLIYSGTQLRMP
jgi:nucleoid-associated protein YgaU